MTSLLRVIACGSVDDGKSTLLGRLLNDAGAILDDQHRTLEADSRRFGTQGDRIDFALLLDGLEAEREQGITIDVAYRYFATPARQFILADAPGHEQYTRNMATGASTADLAILMVDARKGVLAQTRRHTHILAMMGIRDVVLAVNKMDLVGYDRQAFEAIARDYVPFAGRCGLSAVAIPTCATDGDHVVSPSPRMTWYDGPCLLSHLERVEVDRPDGLRPFRMPVQGVTRPTPESRGVVGRVCAGVVRPGDRVAVLPSLVETTVKAILTWDGEPSLASAGDAVTLQLDADVDAGRGDVIAAAAALPPVARHFEARLLWMSEQDLVPGRAYLLKTHSKEVRARVTSIRYRIDMATEARVSAPGLALNDIGAVDLSTAEPLPCEAYAVNRTLGSFILVDPMTFETVGAGMIEQLLPGAGDVRWQAFDISRARRAELKQQRPCCVWFTGLPGAGKTSIANALERRLFAAGRHTYVLDGDNVRHGLNRDLGFTHADRAENVRRIAEVAALMVDAGLVVLVAAISPFHADRQLARSLFGESEFVEVFVDTPLEECERRDPKGLYARARAGLIREVSGIDSPYEAPAAPDVHVVTTGRSVADCVEQVSAQLG
jgi:bifunctional enzyme CysN/CysC